MFLFVILSRVVELTLSELMDGDIHSREASFRLRFCAITTSANAQSLFCPRDLVGSHRLAGAKVMIDLYEELKASPGWREPVTDYSTDAIARRLKQVSEARRLGLSLVQAGRQIRDAAVDTPHTAGESQQGIIPRKR